jgi:hypothetical protein
LNVHLSPLIIDAHVNYEMINKDKIKIIDHDAMRLNTSQQNDNIELFFGVNEIWILWRSTHPISMHEQSTYITV